jgi:hypothetical protein
MNCRTSAVERLIPLVFCAVAGKNPPASRRGRKHRRAKRLGFDPSAIEKAHRAEITTPQSSIRKARMSKE